MDEPTFFRTFERCESTEIHDPEEKHRIIQATLACWLKNRSGRRLLGEGQSSTTDSPPKKPEACDFPEYCFTPEKLQTHELPMRLNVVLVSHPKELLMHGILECHVNGFRFVGSGEQHVHIVLMYEDVSEFFFRYADEKWNVGTMLFRLQDPIMIENQETEDIQFCIWSPQLQGKVTSDKDSDKIDEENPQHGYDNGLIGQFTEAVLRMREKFRLPKPLAPEECEFIGVSPTGRPATFVLTYSALVVLEIPFIVFPLHEIEIVNLALRGPEIIDMTVIFEDFKHGMLEIPSVPSKFLTVIKHRLNSALVKYYVNESKVNWKVVVKEIAENPKLFKENGRWESLHIGK